MNGSAAKADVTIKVTDEKPKKEKRSVMSFFWRVLFSFFTHVIDLASKRPLSYDDLVPLDQEDACGTIAERFLLLWKQFFKEKNPQLPDEAKRADSLNADDFLTQQQMEAKRQEEQKLVTQSAVIDNEDNEDELELKQEVSPKSTTPATAPSLLYIFFRMSIKPFIFSFVMELLRSTCAVAVPILMRDFVRDYGESYSGLVETRALYQTVGIMFMCSFIGAICQAHSAAQLNGVSVHLQGAIFGGVLRKVLLLDAHSQLKAGLGVVLNMCGQDTQRMSYFVPFAQYVWSLPLQIIVVMVMLGRIVGYEATLPVAGVLILALVVLKVLEGKLKELEGEKMMIADKRVKLLTEAITGIKIVKTYAWEQPFCDETNKLRGEELHVIFLLALLRAVALVTFLIAPLLMCLVCFYTYVGLDNELTAEVAFGCLALINATKIPLVQFTPMLTAYASAKVSLQRISEFLLLAEDLPLQNNPKLPKGALRAKGSFRWPVNPRPPMMPGMPPKKAGPPEAEKPPFSLTKINLNVKPGELIQIIGQVGAGKSSLFSAILGSMPSTGGAGSSLNGSVAYCPQRAWLRNVTFKENILFGKAYDAEKYEEVIRVCALIQDRKQLVAGDETEIGEKGINLSGGQKQRISLARAVYADADIYLLDDPLSAVDQETARHIFYQCIVPMLKNKGKTIILATHQVQFLEQADRVYMMEGGTFIKQGTYAELREQGELNYAQVKDEKSPEPESSSPVVEEKKEEVKEVTVVKKEEPKDPKAQKDQKDKGVLIKAEKQAEGSIPFEVYWFYLQSLGGTVLVFALALLYVFSQGSLVMADWWLSRWTAKSFDLTLNQYMAIYGGLAGFGATVAFFRVLAYAHGTRTGAAWIHSSLLKTIMEATMRYFDTTPAGRLIDIMAKDQQFVDTYLPLMFDSYIVMAVSVVGSLILVGIVTYWFFIPFVALAFVYLSYQTIFLRASRSLQRLWIMAITPVMSGLVESIQGADSIRAYRCEERFALDNDKRVDNVTNSYLHSQIAGRWLDARLGIVSAVAILCAGVIVIEMRDSVTPILGSLAFTYAISITGQLNVMVLFASFAETFMVGVQRMKQLLDTTPQEKYFGAKPPERWPTKGQIEFKNVQFRYSDDGPLVLKDVSFTVPAGAKVGIAGRTGAGKSTITLSLFRIVELAGGSINIDGVDIANLGLTELRSAIAIIPQDPVLFEGTVRFNLDPFNQVKDEEIWDVLKQTRLQPTIEQVEGGLNGHVLPGGTNFSVGQRQLFCLARALLRKCNIIVMDEATASIDHETDELIQKMIRTQFAHCTVLTIAHRLNTIADSDFILVLSDGHVAEYDKPSALMARPDSVYGALLKEALGTGDI